MIKLLQESGALSGFNDMASRLASGPRRPLLLAMLMSIIMFVDEYLSVLAVTFALKGTTDRNGIPREHLAFQANAVGCCLCVLVPFSSWVAFTVGLLSDFGLTFDDYISSIPFMFYPVLMFCLLFLRRRLRRPKNFPLPVRQDLFFLWQGVLRFLNGFAPK